MVVVPDGMSPGSAMTTVVCGSVIVAGKDVTVVVQRVGSAAVGESCVVLTRVLVAVAGGGVAVVVVAVVVVARVVVMLSRVVVVASADVSVTSSTPGDRRVLLGKGMVSSVAMVVTSEIVVVGRLGDVTSGEEAGGAGLVSPLDAGRSTVCGAGAADWGAGAAFRGANCESG